MRTIVSILITDLMPTTTGWRTINTRSKKIISCILGMQKEREHDKPSCTDNLNYPMS